MNVLKRRFPKVRDYSAAHYEHVRQKEVEQERCGLCWDIWPVSMMADEDGFRRCPDCIETTGPSRTEAIAKADAENIAAKQTRPQITRVPFRETVPHIRIMEDASGTRVTQNAPLGLVRSGSAATLIIKGGDFASTDTFTYSTGISDSVAPSLSGSTQWTLTLVASGSATPGNNNLTYNNHTYRGILRVG
jgi:hypothetical protein